MYRLHFIKLVLISILLSGIPLISISFSGKELSDYLVFPHLTSPVLHAPFSWAAWLIMAGISLVIFSFFIYTCKNILSVNIKNTNRKKYKLPWWGKSGICIIVIFWILAWNRFDWFSDLQVYTFTPIWLGYILTINALTYSQLGHCYITRQPLYLLALFLLSSIFWWYYEYLNLFINNWYYIGTHELTKTELFIHSSVAYATVLPAVMSTSEWLNSFPQLNKPLKQLWKIHLMSPHLWALASIVFGSIILGLSVYWPEFLFPLVWISPLFIVTGVQYLIVKNSIFSNIANGDWRPVLLTAIAALFCGFFWELWNYKSYAHWEYSVPYVQAFHIFEMPLIGYTGYLPFGMTCIAIAGLLPGTHQSFETPA